ncbi:hypothetical protein PanWU01x14_107490 [Parasponia andersonii]|uniref:Uncharacterized protein n=1 Tax=Parasponia andersonii TaxID=3476 RepID=A0A2P5D086_PARAD|nr:hypothetical protein PanWU01x14_107490 [Parasponia andersonii]
MIGLVCLYILSAHAPRTWQSDGVFVQEYPLFGLAITELRSSLYKPSLKAKHRRCLRYPIRPFSTELRRQALGGHQRCHWEKFRDNSTLSIRALSSLDGGLDLNLPANLEEFDYASSSLALDLRLGL